MSEWKDIGTAPRPDLHSDEQRYILGYIPEPHIDNKYGCLEVVWWEPNFNGGSWWFSGDYEVSPTHWMPLPEPPK